MVISWSFSAHDRLGTMLSKDLWGCWTWIGGDGNDPVFRHGMVKSLVKEERDNVGLEVHSLPFINPYGCCFRGPLIRIKNERTNV